MSDQPNNQDQIEGERGAGITSVAENNRSPKWIRLVFVFLIIIIGIGFLYLTWGKNDKLADKKPQTTLSSAVPFTPATELPRREPQPIIIQKEPEPTQEIKPPEKDEYQELLEASIRAPLTAYSNETTSPKSQTPDEFSVNLPPGFAPSQPQKNALQEKLKVTKLEGVRANVLPNLHMVVPQGVIIPCVLQTAISSDQPGFVSCIMQRDVMSASGQVVLMEKGTTVIGEYTSGLKQGQKRIFVLWNRARTPHGVIINMASPASDGIGRAGFSGKIDTHFWQRFGGAILMSIISDASAYAFQKLDKNTDFETDQTEDAGNNAAAIALENSINIAPTLYKNQGSQVAIFVARDLDFSDVYDLRVVENRRQIFDRTITGDMSKHPIIITK